MYLSLLLVALYSTNVLVGSTSVARHNADLEERVGCAQGNGITCKYCQPPPAPDKQCVAWEARFDHVPAGKKVTGNPPDNYGWFFYVDVEDPLTKSNITPKSSAHAAYSPKGNFDMELNSENNYFGHLIQLYFACAHAGEPVACVLYITATCYKDAQRSSSYTFSASYTYSPKVTPAPMQYVNWTTVEQNKGGVNPKQCYDYFMQTGSSTSTAASLYLDNILFTATHGKG